MKQGGDRLITHCIYHVLKHDWVKLNVQKKQPLIRIELSCFVIAHELLK